MQRRTIKNWMFALILPATVGYIGGVLAWAQERPRGAQAVAGAEWSMAVDGLTPQEQRTIEALKELALARDPNARAVADLLEGFGQPDDGPGERMAPSHVARAATLDFEIADSATRARTARALLENVLARHEIGYRRAFAAPPGDPRAPTGALMIDTRQGALVASPRPLDVAIDGPGLLRVADPETAAPYYTRHGRLDVAPSGKLGIRRGERFYPLQPELVMPRDVAQIVLSTHGELLIRRTRTTTINAFETVGRIELTQFDRPDLLEPVDGIFYRATDASGVPRTAASNEDGAIGQDAAMGEGAAGVLRQSMLEQSNALDSAIERQLLMRFLEWSAAAEGS